MNTKQRIKQLIDSVPEQKAGYVLAYIQGIVAGEDIEGNFNENVLVGNKNDEQSESKSVTSLLDKEGEYTVDDIYALPDLVHMELIDGKMYLMAPTTLTHQNYMGSISNVIYNYARSLDSFSEVYFRLGAFLKNDNKNYVEPDIIVICDKNKLSERGYEGAPDLIIEIISPGSQGMDYGKKLYLYHDTGVREYWIVDYEENHVIVHNFELNTVKMYTLSDKIPVGIYNGDLQIDFSTLNI